MAKRALNELCKSETRAYRETISDFAERLITEAASTVWSQLVEYRVLPDGTFDLWDRPTCDDISTKVAGEVTGGDFDELASAQGIAFEYPKRLLENARQAAQDVVGVRMAMAFAQEAIQEFGVKQDPADWEDALEPHWKRVQKQAVYRLVSAIMKDAFETDEELEDDESDGSSDNHEDQLDEAEDSSDDSKEEEEEDDGEESEAEDNELAEAKEELEEIQAETQERTGATA
jgi:hypothetical protein